MNRKDIALHPPTYRLCRNSTPVFVNFYSYILFIQYQPDITTFYISYKDKWEKKIIDDVSLSLSQSVLKVFFFEKINKIIKKIF